MKDINFDVVNKYYKILRQKLSSFCIDCLHKLNALLHSAMFFCKTNKDFCIKCIIPLGVVGIALYSCSARQNIISRNVRAIFLLSDEIRAFYANKPDYWGGSTASVLKNGFLSKNFVKDNKIVLNDDQQILVGNGIKGDIIMPGTQTFDIVLNGLNKAQCISYSENKLSDDEQVKIVSITVVSSEKTTTFEWGGVNALPVKKYAGKDACSDDNSIIWTLK